MFHMDWLIYNIQQIKILADLFSHSTGVVKENYSANHVYCRRPGPGHMLN